jgi:hypothetical protein
MVKPVVPEFLSFISEVTAKMPHASEPDIVILLPGKEKSRLVLVGGVQFIFLFLLILHPIVSSFSGNK